MTKSWDVSWGVPDKRRSKTELPRPSAEFGRKAVDLAASIGKTKQDLARAAGYTGGPRDPTIDRLMRGQGSMLLGYAVRRALQEWRIDISSLPPLGDPLGDQKDSGVEEWLQEWMELGKELHRVASQRRFQVEVDRVRDVIRAHELVAEGTGET